MTSVYSPEVQSRFFARVRRESGAECWFWQGCKSRRGHLFTPETTYVNPDGRRRCKICQLAAQKRRVYVPPTTLTPRENP
jgi:hypothetical protein